MTAKSGSLLDCFNHHFQLTPITGAGTCMLRGEHIAVVPMRYALDRWRAGSEQRVFYGVSIILPSDKRSLTSDEAFLCFSFVDPDLYGGEVV